jgi:hypothetical protein
MPHCLWLTILLFTYLILVTNIKCQDYDNSDDAPKNPAQDNCVGVFLTYTFTERTKEYPHVKNASAQAYAFEAQATILNTMSEDLKGWQFYVGFQHREILVSIENAVLTNGTDFPVKVGNGTTFSGFPDTDLLNAIDTAGDMNQIQKNIKIKGTQFGVKPPGTPMPKSIKLMNDGFKCPSPKKKGEHIF